MQTTKSHSCKTQTSVNSWINKNIDKTIISIVYNSFSDTYVIFYKTYVEEE